MNISVNNITALLYLLKIQFDTKLFYKNVLAISCKIPFYFSRCMQAA